MTDKKDQAALHYKHGIDRVIDGYRRKFRIPENLNHYSDRDFHEAERQYLRFCLLNGRC